VHCAELIRRYSAQPAADLKHFLNWLLFNLYTGNNDSHAKNLSLYRLPGQGLVLTPFYDLMCTRLYPGLSPNFAFAIGGETQPGKMGRAQLEALARAMGVRPAFVLDIADNLAQRLPAAVAQAGAAIAPLLSPGARTLAEQLERFVLRTTRQIAKRLLRP
jgi:serine/threonine-protein kinase HipA